RFFQRGVPGVNTFAGYNRCQIAYGEAQKDQQNNFSDSIHGILGWFAPKVNKTEKIYFHKKLSLHKFYDMLSEKDFIPANYTSFVQNGSFEWSAPSNIALVKYWGKKENQIPANPSVSFTLNNCKTTTKLK